MSVSVFIGISIAFMLVDVVVFVAALREHSLDGRTLAVTIAFALLVDLFYMLSVTTGDYFMMKVFSSVYFACVDLILVAMLAFLFSFCDLWGGRLFYAVMIAVCVLSVVDIGFLAANPLTEASLTFDYDANSLAHWRYVPLVPYICHLVLCYAMVTGCFAILIGRCATIPRVYRKRYLLILLGLVVIVFVNALFLYIPSSVLLDYSLAFYSVMCIYIYMMVFRDNGKTTLSATYDLIIDQLGRALILFDFKDRYVIGNAEAKQLVPVDKQNSQYMLRDLVADIGLGLEVTDLEKDWSLRRRFRMDGSLRPYRFDLRILRDEKGRKLGKLVVLVDNSYSTDLLTGFHTKSVFEHEFRHAEGVERAYPVTVCVCDLNHLADLNKLAGREIGDEAIKMLAEIMVRHLPRNTFFARHDDANLVAVCEGVGLSSVQKALVDIACEVRKISFDGMNLEMQSAASVATEADPSIIKATDEAISALKMRKMLDFDSAHSSLLASLAMTQRQSDGETEEHVRRTRAVADRLGERLGLSDWDRSSLALLCLLHDIGKVGVPLEILNKPSKLTDVEWQVLQSHTAKGYKIAAASDELRGIADSILHHHERWDGDGYPDKLSKESIPLLSRILAVIDTYDAMTHDRPYRRALSRARAIEELKRCAGTQFDPTIVAEFLAMLDEDSSLIPELAQDAAYVESPGALDSAEAADRKSEESADKPKEFFKGRRGQSAGTRLDKVRYGRYVLDPDQRIVEIYGAFTELTGYSRKDLEAYKLTQSDMLFPQDVDQYWKIVLAQLDANREAYLDHRLRRKDGSALSVFCYGRMFYDSATRTERSEIVIADVSSASSVKNVQNSARVSALHNVEKLEDRANRDDATGLLNRKVFRSEVQTRLFDEDVDVLLIMADIDKFKTYNDTYGHLDGDALLLHMARALEESVGEEGDVGRVGGDEFAIALYLPPGSSSSDVQSRVSSVWNEVSASMAAFREGASVSMGAARIESSNGDITFRDLYSAADQELYRAKNSGRAKFCCNWE